MADIFISYAREDLEKVRLIVRLIEAAGWSAFWDRTIPADERCFLRNRVNRRFL